MATQAQHPTVGNSPLNFYTQLSTKAICPVTKWYIPRIEHLDYPAVAPVLPDGR